jgi:hypothetical protein
LRAVDSYCALDFRAAVSRGVTNWLKPNKHIADLAGIEFDPQVVAKLLLAAGQLKSV